MIQIHLLTNPTPHIETVTLTEGILKPIPAIKYGLSFGLYRLTDNDYEAKTEIEIPGKASYPEVDFTCENEEDFNLLKEHINSMKKHDVRAMYKGDTYILYGFIPVELYAIFSSERVHKGVFDHYILEKQEK